MWATHIRNYHEASRNDLVKVLAPLAVHAAMEDGVEGTGGGSAAMLDYYFDGAADSSVFKEEHVHEHANQRVVKAAIGEEAVALRAAFEPRLRRLFGRSLSPKCLALKSSPGLVLIQAHERPVL